MIEAIDIHKAYGELEVLRGVDCRIEKGEVTAIVGPSGAGKSTLLHIIGTLDKADKGQVIINGEDCSKIKPRALAAFRNESIGFVFQFHHLLPEFSAIENVCMPAFIRGKSKNKVEDEAVRLLRLLGLEDRKKHFPSELSGGEQQRVAVARALINKPAVVLADEPSGNLDSVSADELHSLFFDLRNELEQTFVIVTHNRPLAERCDRTLSMKDGIIVSG